ncbi:hypothetical protein E5K00_02295 [Hymenobacter aquaticus]|uniref:DUF4369 domain-containing protein n=1 Tax=Hymenobacter aquaticus TaxID=1867101 RepID=A0A4Z0Q250_9BACT|nr:hypothetical protein [Hymenobacter aquaticus]TGE24067.1 hypothetical protein E5K00_02295 [Hymenobacter aquaticus]
MPRLYSFAFFSLLAAHQAAGQTPAPDSSFLAAATARLASRQMLPPEENPHLYSGTEYTGYEKSYRLVKGHQFFQSPDEQVGAIFYNGALYQQVPLLYDTRLDQVVLKFPQTPLKLKLVNEKVSYFTVNRHTFVRIVSGGPTAGALSTGYYDVLLNGPVRVLAKRSKKLLEKLTPTGVEAEFEEANRFYLEKGGQFYPIASKGALLAALADRKKEVRQYLSTQKLSFSKSRQEEAFVQVARYYNTLR